MYQCIWILSLKKPLCIYQGLGLADSETAKRFHLPHKVLLPL